MSTTRDIDFKIHITKAKYPSSIHDWIERIDHSSVVFALDPNELADEIDAIENTLGTMPQGDFANVVSRLNSLDVTDILYADLVTAIGEGTLIEGQFYRITDFVTTHYIVDANNVQTGDVNTSAITEPLIIMADSSSTIDKEAHSALYPQDIIYYDWNPENWKSDISFGLAPAVVQTVTIQLTGTSGDATIIGPDGQPYTIVFDNDLPTTAQDFVNNNGTNFNNLVVTTTGIGDLVFTATAWVRAFADPSITNAYGDLAGTVTDNEPFVPATIIPDFKGVIYYRWDTIQDNELGYDFRNVVFRRWQTTYDAWDSGTAYNQGQAVVGSNGGVCYASQATMGDDPNNGYPWISMGVPVTKIGWTGTRITAGAYQDFLTFAEGEGTATYEICVYINHFESTPPGLGSSILTNNVFFLQAVDNVTVAGNNFATLVGNNTFCDQCVLNNFGILFSNNLFLGLLEFNNFGAESGNNIFGTFFIINNVGSQFSGNVIGQYCYFNSMGDSVSNNFIGNSCMSNTIAPQFMGNIIGDAFSGNNIAASMAGNTVASNFHYNNIGLAFQSNIIGNAFIENTTAFSFSSNTLGDYCTANNFGASFDGNNLGEYFGNNVIGMSCNGNTIGASCQLNIIGTNCNSNIVGDNFQSNAIGNNFQNNTLGVNFTLNTVGNNFAQNTTIANFQNNAVYNNLESKDFSTATYVYESYAKVIQNDDSGNAILSYVDDTTNALVFVPATSSTAPPLSGVSSHISNDSTVTGTTIADALDTLGGELPSSDEIDALAGTNGTPSSTNKYVTDSDDRNSDSRAPTAHNLINTTGHPVTGLTSGQIIQATSATAYGFSTPTWPSAATSGKLIIGSGTNYVESTPTYPNSASSAGKILRADGTNFVASSGTYPDTMVAGDVLYASGTNAVSSGVPGKWVQLWTEVTDASATAVVGNGYICNRGTLVTITLPATYAIGDTVSIVGKGAGLWKLATAAGDTIHFGNQNSTSGGYLQATLTYDCVEVVCITANSDWIVKSSIGTLTIA